MVVVVVGFRWRGLVTAQVPARLCGFGREALQFAQGDTVARGLESADRLS